MEILELSSPEDFARAGRIRSLSWMAECASICPENFVRQHSAELQREYLLAQAAEGARFFMLKCPECAGIISLRGSLIENLYVLPEMQNRGLGTALLSHALRLCPGRPELWVLEQNEGARRLYEAMGFRLTGERKAIIPGLFELQMLMGRD